MNYFLQTDKVGLRKLDAVDTDYERYYRWMNDPLVTRYLESRFRSWSVDDLRSYVYKTQRDQNVLLLGIFEIAADTYIGNIKLGPINWTHKTAEVGLLIGEKDCWGRGYATDAIWLVKYHAFNVLGLHRLTAGAYACNLGSVKAFCKAGFVQEALLKQSHFCKGEYVDSVILSALNS